MPEHGGSEKNINKERPRGRKQHIAWVTLVGAVVAGIEISAKILGDKE